MKKIYTGKSLEELKELAVSEITALGVSEADIKEQRKKKKKITHDPCPS